MPSTAAMATRTVNAQKRIDEAIERMDMEVPPIGKDYRNPELRRVLVIEQFAAIMELISPPPVIEVEEPDEDVTEIPEDDEPTQDAEIPEDESDDEPSELDEFLIELQDMESDELRKYADNMGVKYPVNIKDSTLINKMIQSRKHQVS